MPTGAAIAASTCPLGKRAARICDSGLRHFDGTDVFALSPTDVLVLAKAIRVTERDLRSALPGWTNAGTRPLRVQMRTSSRLGRIYSRAYRADPTDNSLPEEAAFENSLLDLEREADRAELSMCSVKLATP